MERSPVKPEDIASLPLVSSPALSPEGGRIAYVLTRINLEKNRYESSIYLADGRDARPLTGGLKDTCPSWSPNGRRIAFIRRIDDEGGAGIYLASPEGGEPWKLAWLKHGASSLSWDAGGRYIYLLSRAPLGNVEWKDYEERDKLEVTRLPVWLNGEGFVFDRFTGLYRIHAASGIVEELAHGPFEVTAYAVDPSGGRIAYAATYDEMQPHRQRLFILDMNSGEEEMLLEGLSIASIAWSPGGDMIAVNARGFERGFATHYKIYLVDPSGGKPRCLTCSLGRNTLNTAGSDIRGPSCAKSLEWGRDNQIYFLVSDAGRAHLYSAGPDGEIHPLIAPECGVVDEFSVSGKRIAYTYMDPYSPKELYILGDEGSRRVTSHTEEWVGRRVLGEQRRIQVKASDGAVIDVWILEPADKPNGAWILYVHGGPKIMHGCGFMHEYHVLSGAGYTLVLPNPRGSDGYSEEFADIRRHYGDKDYQDLMEVFDAVVAEGLDPGRAGVAGGSYGGFMTNWIVGHTDRFKAAVTQRSISNWTSKYGTTDIGFYYNKEQIGGGEPPWRLHDEYWYRSPLRYVDNIRTPMLIIHSSEDYRCWLDQALQLYTALKEKRIPVKLVLFLGENHDLSRSGKPRKRIARIKEMLAWFDEHLLGDPG